MRERLDTIVNAYRGLLQADERKLHEAMLEYERSCWKARLGKAA